jgi:hypothetical protein
MNNLGAQSPLYTGGKKKMKYTIEVFKNSGERVVAGVLTAQTDRGALRQARKYMATAKFERMDLVVLRWVRASDGCSGYLCTLKSRGCG